MRKKVDYKLEYREEGESKEITISIDFVSNRVLKLFSELVVLGSKVDTARDRMSDIYSIKAGEKLSDEEKGKLDNELEDLKKQILEFNDNGYFEQREEILRRLLIDNGYKNNELLMSPEFWDECIEPGDLLIFMFQVIYKDVDMKKKVLGR